jgi:hypothetical protein
MCGLLREVIGIATFFDAWAWRYAPLPALHSLEPIIIALAPAAARLAPKPGRDLLARFYPPTFAS